MNLKMIVQDVSNGSIFDISELVINANVSTSMFNQAGKLTFDYLDDALLILSEGSSISLTIDGKGIFFGFIFKQSKKQDEKISVIAYDQMRYLRNKDTYTFTNLTASQIFTKVCNDVQLVSKVVNPSDYIISPRIFDNKTLFEIINYSIDTTLVNIAKWYMIRDNFGILEFVDINTLKTDLFIGDESLLIELDYSSSIDDTYNQIKLIQDNKETKKRDVYIVKDSTSIKQWGLLQYTEKLDESVNSAQVQAKAHTLLKLKNKATKKLKINCLGDLRVSAGSGIILGISSLSKDGFNNNQYFMVEQCTHKFTNSLHQMDLELELQG